MYSKLFVFNSSCKAERIVLQRAKSNRKTEFPYGKNLQEMLEQITTFDY